VFVVCFHNVLPGPLDVYDRQSSRLKTSRFVRDIDFLVRHLHPVSLPAMLEQLRAGRPDPKAVAITFDDGFRGVLDHAFPHLADRGIPASVFVVTSRLDPDSNPLFHFDEIELACRLTRRRRYLKEAILGVLPLPMASAFGRAWTLKRIKRRLKVLPEEERRKWHARILDALEVTPEKCRVAARSQEKYQTLSSDDLRTLIDAGWTVGSHTRSHRTLSRLAPDELRDEINGSRDDLARHLGIHDIPIAYPYGDAAHISEDVQREAERAGYSCGLTMIPGANSIDVDRFALRRMEFWQLRKAVRF
jgi:peptidoglycan/xylan/chitin deacetylase (PgdA/CDA1 family)